MILEAMFNGRFYPAETVTPTNSEYWAANQQVSQIMEQLSSRLSAENFSLLTQLREQLSIVQMLEMESHFKYGFASGVLLHQEIISVLGGRAR